MRGIFVSLMIGLGVGGWYLLQRGPGPEYPSPEAAVASPAFLQAVARGDSTGIADMAVRQCRVTGEPCYHTFLLRLADEDRIALAMGVLEEISRRDDRVLRHGHDYAHIIGMRGFDPARPVGETFSTCRMDFQSGCYHGVIQAYLTSLDTIGPSEVSALCSDVPAVRESLWVRFQCAHGLGHGLLMRYEHHLPRGLAGCDLLESAWDRESCYGGAFMENVAATDPHHMPVRETATANAEEHGDHEDHGAGAVPDPEPPPSTFARINPADPHYPCSVLNEHYKRSCYGMQTSLMLELTKFDFGRTSRMCDGAPVAYRTTCYQSLGTNISGNTVRNAKKAIETCNLGTTRYQPWCYLGVVKNFIDVTAQPEDGFSFCQQVVPGPNKMMCYRAIGEQLSVLFADLDERKRWCATVEGGHRESCAFGARLTAVPPDGMPRFELLNNEPD